jgi:hypothetical protein
VYFRKADIGGTQGDAWISKAVRWGTRQKYEPPTLVNHSFMVVNDRDAIEDVKIVEAVVKVKHRGLVEAYGGSGTRVELWRALNFSDEQRDRMVEEVLSYVGVGYPWHRLLFHLADERLFAGRRVLRHLAFLKRWKVCTPLVVAGTWVEGFTFGFSHPHQATPDGLRDFLADNPTKYVNYRKLQEVRHAD